ncbi:MAG: beta-N-acetylhexosaminidase [Bryobacteraceae bacterium]
MGPKLLTLLAPVTLAAQNLMPWPAAITSGQGRMPVTEAFRVQVSGSPDARVTAGAARLSALVARITGMPLEGGGAGPVLLVAAGNAADDESYKLSVKPEGARLDAAGPLGALHGMATFAQLLEPRPNGFGLNAVEIDDRPRFPWRGLLLDVARHWMPMDVVKRTLDGMAAVKLNVFHLHLSDDQGFHIESKRYPKLHQMGSDGRYFTQEQIREIVAWARERGIRVIPEFDMPGHTTSWFVGYPELASAPGPYAIERKWGVHDPAMDPTREEVYRFLDGFIGEMAALFPDPYFHIGGDEVNGKQWNANPRIVEFKSRRGMQSNADLQAYFTRRVQEIVKKHGKRMVGWDEILHPDLPREIVVHSWRGQKSLAQAASRGFSGLLSNGYYLDLMHPAARHYAVDPINKETGGLSADERGRILGGEACMWAEYVTAENVEGRIWPRAAAIAERLWSPAHIRDVESMYGRLEAVSRQLEWLGLRHAENYHKMIERLSAGYGIGAVNTLASVVEPVKDYARGRMGKYTSFTPLNRLVDTVRPESMAARRFEASVAKYLEDGSGAEVIRRQLIAWRENHNRLAPVLAGSPLLAEAAPISRDLSEMAAAALAALDYREKRAAAAPVAPVELMKRASQPRAELLLSVAPALGRLIEAVK